MCGGFTVKHFHEKLVKRHGYKLGYRVTRLALRWAGLVRPAKRRSAHSRKRPRRPMAGMMPHRDGPGRHANPPGSMPRVRPSTTRESPKPWLIFSRSSVDIPQAIAIDRQ